MAPFQEARLQIICHAVEHGNGAAARELNINESTVPKWRKQQAAPAASKED